jgi:sensor histidine kinase YesM
MLLRGNSWLVGFFVALTFSLNASLPAKNFNVKDGLVSNVVRCLHEDKNGDLWIGTDGGISIYNGYFFKTITAKEGLKGNFVWAIVDDPFGGKWVASYNDGLTYIKNGVFTTYGQKEGLTDVKIRTIHYQNEKLFIGAENGLFVFDYKTKKIKNLTPKTKDTDDFQVMQFLTYRNELIIVTRKRGLYKAILQSEKQPKIQQFGKGLTVFKIIPYDDKFLYCTTSGIYRQTKILTDNGKLINGNVVWDYTQAKESKTTYLASWNATQAGGALLQLDRDSLVDVTKKYQIQSEAIWAVKCLSTRQLVVGTLDKGIYLVDLQQSQSHFFPIRTIKGRISHKGATYYYSEKLIYDQHGKIRFELTEENLKKWIRQKGLVNTALSDLTIPITSYSLVGHRINEINTSDEGIFLSTTLGLIHLSHDFKIIRLIPLVIDKFHLVNNTMIYHKPYKELNVFRNLTNSNISRESFPTDEKTPTDIIHFQQLHNRTVLWTKVKGAFIFTDGKQPYQQLKLDVDLGQLKSVHSFKNEFILVNSKDEVYTGTIVNDKIKLRQIHLPVDIKSIYKVLLHNSNFALHFDKGIYIATPSSYRILNRTNLLTSGEIVSVYLDENQLEVITDYGIQTLLINEIFSFKNHSPNVHFKSNLTTIASYQNSLVLHLKTTALQHPNDNTFYYQLNGQDTVPISDAKIYLMNLSSGSYNLNLLAYNGFTNRWTVLNSYSFTKEKALWEKTYFWLVLTSLISLFAVIIYYRRKVSRNKQLIQKQELEKEVIQQKLQAIQAKMNPHFMFNALNSIQNYIIDTDTDNALLYLSEFAKLMRQTIEYSSLNAISLTEELEFLKRYIRIEQMRFSSEIELLTEGTEISESIQLPPMILQPLIENAFIHGLDTQAKTKQQIHLKLEKRDESRLLISISNPKSNPASSFKEHQSFGIKSIEQRLKLVHPSNTLKTQETETHFTVQLEIRMNE